MAEYAINIISESENKLLNRREIKFEIQHPTSSTPKRLEIKKKIAAQLNKDENLAVIIKLDTKYGIGLTIGHARIYNSLNDINQIEPKHIIKRNQEKQQKEEE